MEINCIVFEYFTASIVDLMVANIKTQFATIKSPIDAVKFSNTIQLSPNFIEELQLCQFTRSRA
jgi:hypothetical protein